MPAVPTDSHALVSALYRQHHGWLQTWLRRRLDDAGHAADLSQDTFLRILRARDPPRIQRPREYLSTIARGLLVDHYRRRALEQAWLETIARLPEPQVPSLEAQSLLMESLLRIDAMLDGLRPKVRQAFLMSQLEDLPYREIARRLGVSLRTVNHYMAEAMTHCLELAP